MNAWAVFGSVAALYFTAGVLAALGVTRWRNRTRREAERMTAERDAANAVSDARRALGKENGRRDEDRA